MSNYLDSLTNGLFQPKPQQGGSDENISKFLDFLSKAEGADYNTIVGGGKFDNFDAHPGVVGLRTKNGPSTAAGRYQITKTTYDDFAPKLGISDFSPESQDRIAQAIIEREGALDDVKAGNFDTAIQKLGGRWASLPSSKYGQPIRSKEWVDQQLATAMRPKEEPQKLASSMVTGEPGYGDVWRQITQDEAQRRSDESPVSTSLKRGWNQMTDAIGNYADLQTGNIDGITKRLEAAQQYDLNNPSPSANKQWMDDFQKGNTLGWMTNISGFAGANAEQLANSVPSMAGSIPGAIAGAAVGSSVTPGIGTLIGGVIGGAFGSAPGSVATETGARIGEMMYRDGVDMGDPTAVNQWLTANRDKILGEGLTKGLTVAAADGLFQGIGARVIAGPAMKFSQAEAKVLAGMGVNQTDAAALKAARESVKYKTAMAAPAAELKAATTVAKNAMRGAVSFLGESAGEFSGEYFGEQFATGEGKLDDALLEALMAGGTSVATTGAQFAASRLIGDKAGQAQRSYLDELASFTPTPANSPLTSAANVTQLSAPQDQTQQLVSLISQRDDIAAKISAVADAISRRGESPETTQILSDLTAKRDALAQQIEAAKAASSQSQLPPNVANVRNRLDSGALEREQQNAQLARGAAQNAMANQGQLADEESQEYVGNEALQKQYAEQQELQALIAEERKNQERQIKSIWLDQHIKRTTQGPTQNFAGMVEYENFLNEELENLAQKRAEAKVTNDKAKAQEAQMAEERLKDIARQIEEGRDVESAKKRNALLDQVLASNPQNPLRAFDRALKLEGFRDTAFSDAEKEKIARFGELRQMQTERVPSVPNDGQNFGIAEKAEQPKAKFRHIHDMLGSGWTLQGKQLVSRDGKKYNLKNGELAVAKAKVKQAAPKVETQIPHVDPTNNPDVAQLLSIAQPWDRANRTSRSQEWMAGAAESTPDFAALGEAGNRIPAHGMAKVATLGEGVKNLIAMLSGGIDPNRTLYYDALTANGGNAGAGTGTAGGHAYWDGPFVITFSEGLNGRQPTSADVTGILVNPANAEIIPALQQAFPNIPVRSYHDVSEIVGKAQEETNPPIVEQAGREQELSKYLADARSLQHGDVVETDTGDSFVVLTNTPVRKGSDDRWIEVRWDTGKEIGMIDRDVAILLSPQPYQRQDGYRGMSDPATITRKEETNAPIVEQVAQKTPQANDEEARTEQASAPESEGVAPEFDAETQSLIERAAKAGGRSVEETASLYRKAAADKGKDFADAALKHTAEKYEAEQAKKEEAKPKKDLEAIKRKYKGEVVSQQENDKPSAAAPEQGSAIVPESDAEKFAASYRAKTDDKRAEFKQTLEDMIVTNKEMKKPYQHLADRLAMAKSLDAGENIDSDAIYSNVVEGHAENNDHPLLRNLVPNMVRSVEDIARKLDFANELYQKHATDLSKAEYALSIAKTAAAKKSAQAEINRLQKAFVNREAIDTLRTETIPELNRLHNEAVKRWSEPAAVNAENSQNSEQVVQLKKRIAEAEQRTAVNPTEAQKESGNYVKGKFPWRGMTIAIETPKDAERSGIGEDGQEWRVIAPVSYGYFLSTKGADKEHLDVYIGEKPESENVFVINQNKVDSAKFDEHKVLIGFETAEDAKRAYFGSFTEGFAPRVFGSISGPYSVAEFKEALPKMEKAKPLTDRVETSPKQETANDSKAKYEAAAAKYKEKQAERAIVPLDKITVTRSATLDGTPVEYEQRADEAIAEIDKQMNFGKQLLECLAA